MSYKCESCKWYVKYKEDFTLCNFFDMRTNGGNSARDCKHFQQHKLKPNKRKTKFSRREVDNSHKDYKNLKIN